jgi:DNA repair protein RecO (recombination protein O)
VPSEQTEAIVLRIYPWSETSLIAHLYTREFGKISVLAKGARRPKSPFEAALDLLSLCRIVFIPKASDALSILTEAKLTRRLRAGTNGLLRLYAAYYFAELLDQGLDEGTRQPELFEFVDQSLKDLEDDAICLKSVVLRFEMQLLRMTGHSPTLRMCAVCGEQTAEQDWVLFAAVAGGITCPGCRRGMTNLLRVPRSVVETAARFADENWQQIDVHADLTENNAALRKMIERFIVVQYDRTLRLHRYLEELGR